MNVRRLATVLAASLLLLACAGGKPLAADQQNYAGRWESRFGAYVTIWPDGGGELKDRTTSIKGGSATIADGSLSIGFGPLSKKLKITKPPTQVGGSWVMELDGVPYVKK